MYNLYNFNIFCPDNNKECICRDCKNSQLNGGYCTHCFNCSKGEKSTESCEKFVKL